MGKHTCDQNDIRSKTSVVRDGTVNRTYDWTDAHCSQCGAWQRNLSKVER